MFFTFFDHQVIKMSSSVDLIAFQASFQVVRIPKCLRVHPPDKNTPEVPKQTERRHFPPLSSRLAVSSDQRNERIRTYVLSPMRIGVNGKYLFYREKRAFSGCDDLRSENIEWIHAKTGKLTTLYICSTLLNRVASRIGVAFDPKIQHSTWT